MKPETDMEKLIAAIEAVSDGLSLTIADIFRIQETNSKIILHISKVLDQQQKTLDTIAIIIDRLTQKRKYPSISTSSTIEKTP